MVAWDTAGPGLCKDVLSWLRRPKQTEHTCQSSLRTAFAVVRVLLGQCSVSMGAKTASHRQGCFVSRQRRQLPLHCGAMKLVDGQIPVKRWSEKNSLHFWFMRMSVSCWPSKRECICIVSFCGRVILILIQYCCTACFAGSFSMDVVMNDCCYRSSSKL